MRQHHYSLSLRYLWSPIMLLIAGLITCQLSCAGKDCSSQPYLILYAFDAEGETLSRQMSIDKTEKHLGRKVITGQLSGQQVVLAESGIGMTNAAMTAQRMIDQFKPHSVIMTGIAGAIDSMVQIGDIVACGEWIEHDYGYVGGEGFKPSKIGIVHPVFDSLVKVTSFPVDSSLFSVAEDIVDEELDLAEIGSRFPRLLVGGIGVSGNTFIDSKEKRQWLSAEFGALVTDMESAAVAQVCTVNDVPFIVFRSASDLAGGSGSETARAELREFFRIAAGNSSKIVVQLLEGCHNNPY